MRSLITQGRSIAGLPSSIRPSSVVAKFFSSSPASSAATASTSTTRKPKPSNTLAKPDKFRPPSHGSRLARGGRASSRHEPRNYPGPKLSEAELEARRTRSYPNMFPAEGTVMHKFLTNRGIHVWISMSVLFALASFSFSTDFKHSSPYANLLPPWSGLLSHPWSTIGQFFHVLKLDRDHHTQVTIERRKKNIDDVEKRRLYRVAHGLEEPSEADREKEGQQNQQQQPQPQPQS